MSDDLPMGWVWTNFVEIAENTPNALKAGPFGSALKKSFYVPSGYKIYGQEQVIKEDPFYGDYYIDEEKYNSLRSCSVKPKDILISLVGTIGKVLILPEGISEGIINPRLVKLSLHKSLTLAEFIKAYLESPSVRDYFSKLSHGGTMDILNLTTLKALPILLPPLNEQRQIVDKLDRIGDRHRTARNELSHIPKLIARYKQAVLTAACSGKLTEDWREKNPSGISRETLYQRILQECEEQKNLNKIRGKGTNRSVPIQNNILPEVPSSWVWITADECAYDLTVGHVGSMKDSYVLEGIPFLRSFNVKPNTIDLDGIVYITEDFHNQLKKSSLSPGTVVVIRTGDPGVAAVIPDSLQIANCSDLVICRFIKLIFPIFAAYYINSSFSKLIVEKSQVGVAQQHFNVGAMSKLPMPIPPLEEQKEIIRRVEKMFEKIDMMEQEYQKAAKLCDRLEQATLAKAFRGELVPQDPDDEPASVLLEQVKREKEKGKKVRM